jgi:mono/diheme cytochrome c family protein
LKARVPHHGLARHSLARIGCVAVAAVLSANALASPAQDYMLHCMGCHGVNAQGVPGKVPALAHTLVQFMRTPAGRSYVLRVPGASNSMLSDAQLAAVLNWIAGHFSPDPAATVAPFTDQEVSAHRRVPMSAVQATRREVVKELAASGSAPADDY